LRQVRHTISEMPLIFASWQPFAISGFELNNLCPVDCI